MDTEEITTRADHILADALVVSGAEIVRVDPAGKPKLMLDPLEMGAAVIDQWQACGFDVVVPPIASFKLDHHAENFRLIAGMNAFLAAHSDRLMRIDRAGDIPAAAAAGKVGVLICVHQAEHFRTVDDVDMFHAYGQRSSLITSHGQNALGSPVGERHDGGLSHFGAAVVARMNKVGMVVDVSHCAERTTLEAVEASSRPLLCSHANAAAICPNPRNKSDAAIRAVASTGGVIGVMCLRMLVTSQEPTGVENMLDHIAHIADLVGPDHVGLGFEVPTLGWDALYDGAEKPIPLPSYMRNEGVQRKLDIAELSTIRRVRILTEAMVRRGWAEDFIRGVLGQNFARALDQILVPASADVTAKVA